MRSFLATALVCLAPAATLAGDAGETPWEPRAAAYRLTLFMGNLTPVPWDRIEASWSAAAPGTGGAEAALAQLPPDQAAALQAALAAQDRQALFAAATRAAAGGIISHLEAAEAALGTAAASGELAQAAALYRAFADAVEAADPQAAGDLAGAWAGMQSAADGDSGGAEAFAAARAVVADYIGANYLPEAFAARSRLTPLPETVAASGADVMLPAALPPGSNIGDQSELPRLVLQFEEAGEDEADLPLVAFGDMLFDSPLIFGSPARDLGIACSTCHNRSDVNREFFIPGLSHRPGGMDVDGAFFNPMFNDRKDDHLDTPSMRGIRFTAPYGRDGREPSLRRFVRNVIVTEFAGPEPTPFQLDALVAYIREFDFLPNPQIDGEGRLTDLASDAARRGEALFYTAFAGLGDRSCASCHTPERQFRDGQTYDIGSAEAPFPGGTATPFETPTLRNINFTAPYMHDGSLPTLASVVAWFNTSKGLGLTATQCADLTAYLEAVGDGEEPYQRFEGRNTGFRLAWEELTTFASTLDTLLPMQDRDNIALLVATVAPDLAEEAGDMENQPAAGTVRELSGRLQAVGDASAAGNWAEAGRHWLAFKEMQDAVDADMY